MSRKLLAFLLSELGLVRIICRRPTCGATVEMSLEQVGTKFKVNHPPECPVCGGTFQGLKTGWDNELVRLSESIRALRDRKDVLEVEFVLPDTSGE